MAISCTYTSRCSLLAAGIEAEVPRLVLGLQTNDTYGVRIPSTNDMPWHHFVLTSYGRW